MEVLDELNNNKGIAIALGFFDGMHLGHKKIIKTLVEKAKERKLKTAVITFDSNPSNYFNPTPVPNLQSFKDREVLIASLGVDFLYELNFEQLKDLSATEYINNVIKKNLDPKLVVVGYNHTFGKDREGNCAFLSSMAQKLGFELIVVPEYKYKDTDKISSSIIRQRIQLGHLNAAKAFLGRSFSVGNSVIKGEGKATTLGCPTANIIWPDNMVKLPYGVYYGYCRLETKSTPALISWGVKPTVSIGKHEILEVHLYNTSENLYGKIITVVFDKKVRDEQNFGNIKALEEQIKKDLAEFKEWAKVFAKH